MRSNVFLIAMVLLWSAMAVFAGGDSESGATAESVVFSAPGVFPIVETPVSLTIMVSQDAAITDVVDNHATRYMEELTNVKIEWQAVPSASYGEKFNLVLASGDLPDVFMTYGVSSSVVQQNGNAGTFLRLNELIDDHAVNLRRILEENPFMAGLIRDQAGNIWGLPATNDDYHGLFQQKLWVNRRWLDALDLDIPTTTQEFYEMLVAFRDGDPNGNGKRDEIPFAGASTGWRMQLPSSLMNAFVYWSVSNPVYGLYLEDGAMEFAAITEGYREGLRYYRRLYAEGLLDPASFTQKNSELKQLVENPEANLIGAVTAGVPGVFLDMYGASGRYRDYVTVPPLTGPDGTRTIAYYGTPEGTKGPNPNRFLVTSACRYPEIAIKWADHRYSIEGTLNTTIGEENVNWRYANPGEEAIIEGEPALWQRISGAEEGTMSWRLVGPNYNPWDTFKGLQVRFDDMYAVGAVEQWLYEETSRNYDIGVHPDVVPFWNGYFYTAEQAEVMSQLSPAINGYTRESFVRFVTGDWDIEADWDTYVSEFDKLNLDQYLEIIELAHNLAYNQ